MALLPSAAACLLAGAACGDVSDASLPLDVTATGDRAGVTTPSSQAVLALEVGTTGAGGRCGASLSAMLPDETALATLSSSHGTGARVAHGQRIDGERATVACTVTPVDELETTFDVELRFAHPHLGLALRGTGTLVDTRPHVLGNTPLQSLAIELFAGDDRLHQADCEAEVQALVAGAVWLSAVRCPRLLHTSDPLSSCLATGKLLFEHCK
jgi:hypothetical protein